MTLDTSKAKTLFWNIGFLQKSQIASKNSPKNLLPSELI